MSDSAYQDLLKDTSESKENGNYFLVTVSDLDPNRTYPIQFRWMYKDKRVNDNWSNVKLIITPGESEPNTPAFGESNVDVSSPEKIIITWDGTSDDGGGVQITNYDRVDVYIDGAPFDGTKPAYSFKAPGTTTIAAPAGDYQIVLYAVSKTGKLSPVSAAVTKTVTAAGEVIQTPTLPSGVSAVASPFAVTINWDGSYSSSTFTGFKSIDIYAVGSDLGSTATSGISASNLVGSLTVNDTTNRINVGLDNLKQALSLATTQAAYTTPIFFYYNARNKNDIKYGSPTYTRINSTTVNPIQANYVDLASGVISIEHLEAGNGTFASWLRVGSNGGSRIELSGANTTTPSGSMYPVKKGLVAYSSGNTEVFNLDTAAGTLTINGSGTFTGDLSAGSGNSIFKADSNGIYLGNATYSSAPFHVSRNGVLKAESGTIGGWGLADTYLKNTADTFRLQSVAGSGKYNLTGFIVGDTSQSYFTIEPNALTHRNSNGTASGKFTLTLGASSQLTLDGTLTVGGSSVATSSQLSAYATTTALNTGLGTKIGASDVNTNVTNISGGVIKTGVIDLNLVYLNNASSGSRIELTASGLKAYSGATNTVAINSDGTASFAGTITASSGSIAGLQINSDSIGTGLSTSGFTIFPDPASSGVNYRYYDIDYGIRAKTLTVGDTSNNGTATYPLGSSSLNVFDKATFNNAVSVAGALYTAGNSSGTATDLTQGAYLSSSGYVLGRRIGGIPLYAHRITDSSGRLVQFYFNGSSGGGIDGSSSTTPAFAGTSDYRAKKNIETYSGALEKLNLTRPVSFTMKSDEQQKTQVGFIAHEFAEIFPQFVYGEKDAVDENGDPVYQEMSTGNLVPYLVAAIKELSARLDALEA